jgi:hypothetical protein
MEARKKIKYNHGGHGEILILKILFPVRPVADKCSLHYLHFHHPWWSSPVVIFDLMNKEEFK